MTSRSNAETLVTVYGGSGFLGRHVVRALAKRNYLIRVAVRRPDLANHLQPLGRVGQIHAVQANLRYAPSVEAAARDAQVLINLVGILFERGRQRFDTIHAYGAEQVALAASAQGARLVHVSAIGGGTTRFQPVFVGDVAAAIAEAVDGNARDGTVYELGGPEVRTFEQLMQYVLATIERKRLLVPVPFFAAKIKATLLQYMPKPPLTPDQVDLLRVDNVVSEPAKAEGRTLQGLGIAPEPIEAIVPSYLWRFRKTGQFRSRIA